MGILSREQLLTKEELKKEQVDLGNDEFVFVRQMTGRERDQFEQSLVITEERMDGSVTYTRALDDFRAKLAVCTICDEEGKLLLRQKDVSQLSMSMSAAKLELIVNKAQALNRITPEDKEALVKNSPGAQSEGSTSD
jgi:hypothetical protein